MSLRFIYGRAGYGKSEFCLQELRRRLDRGEEENYPLILVVPEQFSFEAEKNLMNIIERDPGHRAKILSFRRMTHRVFTEVGGLTREHMNAAGRSMLLHSLLQKSKGELQIYGKAASSQGFVEKISSLIVELKNDCIAPEELAAASKQVQEEVLKKKLMDISLIYREYEEAIHQNYIDTEDDLELLYDKMDDTTMFDGAELYFDEFTGFTAQQYRIIEKLMVKCRRINVALISDGSTGGSSNTQEGDLFQETSETEETLLRLAAQLHIPLDEPVRLHSIPESRYKNNHELLHLEQQLYAYPYKPFLEKNDAISIYKAANIYEEVEEAAREISRLVKSNVNGEEEQIRYRDILVATRDLPRYESLIRAIFSAYEIPCFIDQRREIGSNPFILFVTSLIECFSKNWTYESVFRCLKTGVLKIDDEELSQLENYVLSSGIRGKRWFEEHWEYAVSYDFYSRQRTEEEEQKMERINKTKNEIIAILGKLYHTLQNHKQCKQYCIAFYEFLEEQDIPERLNEYIRYFTDRRMQDKVNEYSQIWSVLVEVLEQAVEVLGETELTLEEFGNILALGFSEFSTGSIPPSVDVTTVGSIDRMRSHKTKALIILGANDGVLPKVQSDEGTLNDLDRETLKQLGLNMAKGTKARAFEEQFLIYKALVLPTEKLRISYPVGDHDGKTMRPSMILSRLKRIFPQLMEESNLTEELNPYSELKNLWAALPAFHEMILHSRPGMKASPIWSNLQSLFSAREDFRIRAERAAEGYEYSNLAKELNQERAAALYGKDPVFSVSRLEKYAQCPFAYFIKYGLKARDRKIYSTSSPDIGTFLHNVLDEFSQLLQKEQMSWKEVNRDFCSQGVQVIVSQMMEKLPGNVLESSARYRQLTVRLKRLLTTALTVIAEHIKRSDFVPSGFEEGFGPNQKYPPILIELDDGQQIKLAGRIDRIDFMEQEAGKETYVRILDYKSGNKDIKLMDVFYGLQLQLLTYLEAILTGCLEGELQTVTPAGILYFKVDDPIVRGKPGMEEETAERELLRELKLKGLLLAEYDAIVGMDNHISGMSDIIPAAINKDGSLSSRSKAISREQFKLLRDYVSHTIKGLSTQLLKGSIEIKPYRKKKETPCKFCDYASICRFDPSISGNQYRQLSEKSDDVLWTLMEKTVKGGESNEQQMD